MREYYISPETWAGLERQDLMIPPSPVPGRTWRSFAGGVWRIGMYIAYGGSVTYDWYRPVIIDALGGMTNPAPPPKTYWPPAERI